MKRSAAKLAAELLYCGYLDIEFLLSVEEAFDTSVDYQDLLETYDKVDVNSLIDAIYYEALYKVSSEFQIPLEDIEFEIYTNCIDSSLSIKDIHGEWQLVTDISELRDILEKFYEENV